MLRPNNIVKALCALPLLSVLITSAFAAGSVAARVKSLSEPYFQQGRTVKTQATDPQKMIYRYICVMHSPDEARQFKLVKGATKIKTDEMVAGTLTTKAAADAVANQFIENQMNAGVDLDPDGAKAMGQLVRELAKDGCSFGFDGAWQNEGPSPYLLVIDPAGKAVYGIDLNPSEP